MTAKTCNDQGRKDSCRGLCRMLLLNNAPSLSHIYGMYIQLYIYCQVVMLSLCEIGEAQSRLWSGARLWAQTALGQRNRMMNGPCGSGKVGSGAARSSVNLHSCLIPVFLYDGFSVLTKLPWLSADSYCYINIVNWITDGGFCNCRILSWHSIFMNEFCSLCRLLWQGLPLGQLPYSFSTSLSAFALLVKTRNVWGRTRIANFGSSWACHKLGYQLISVISDLIKLWCWHLFTEGGLQLQHVYCLGHRLVAYHTTL